MISASKLASGVSSLSPSLTRGYKVAVLGAAGGIGQSLSLLLKMDSKITELSLFDVLRTPGVAADLSHIPSKAKVTGYVGTEQVHQVGCLYNLHVLYFYCILGIVFLISIVKVWF